VEPGIQTKLSRSDADDQRYEKAEPGAMPDAKAVAAMMK